MHTQDLVRGCMSRRAGGQADGVRHCWWVGERLHKHRLTWAFYWKDMRPCEDAVLVTSVPQHAGRRRTGERMGELLYKQASWHVGAQPLRHGAAQSQATAATAMCAFAGGSM